MACQTAIFDPAGMSGLLYWYALYPLHELVFAGGLSRPSAKPRPEKLGVDSVFAG